MKVIYSSGPITSTSQFKRWRYIMEAHQYAFEIWKRGGACLCPQLNTWGFDDPAVSHETFLEGDFEMIRRCCDGMLMLPGWRDSKGAVKEWQLAKELTIPIFFTDNLARLWAFLKTGEIAVDIKREEVVDAAH